MYKFKGREDGRSGRSYRLSPQPAASFVEPSSHFVSSSRPGFTFVEILFAVIIIGIGFVMIAALFPVAIQQQQANIAEGAAVSIGRDAIRAIQMATSNNVPAVAGQPYVSTLPPTFYYNSAATPPAIMPLTTIAGSSAAIMPLPNTLVTGTYTPGTPPTFALGAGATYAVSNVTTTADWAASVANPAILQATGNSVSSSDPRFAWLGFYRRDVVKTGPATYSPAPYAQVWIVVAQATAEGQPTFSVPPPINLNNTLVVTPTYIAAGSTLTITHILVSPATVGKLPNGPYPAASGAYGLMLYSDDTNAIGQVLHLGAPTQSPPSLSTYPNSFALQPDGDLNPNDPFLATEVNQANRDLLFILGSPPTGGRAQDITVVTGMVRVSN